MNNKIYKEFSAPKALPLPGGVLRRGWGHMSKSSEHRHSREKYVLAEVVYFFASYRFPLARE